VTAAPLPRCTAVGLACLVCDAETVTRPEDAASWAAGHLWPTLRTVMLDTGDGPVVYEARPITGPAVTL
jgi:hypothetical protein